MRRRVSCAAGLSVKVGITCRALSMSRARSGAWVREAIPRGMLCDFALCRIEDTAG